MCDHIQVLLEDWMRVRIAAGAQAREDVIQRLGMRDELGAIRTDAKQRFQNLLENVPPGTAKSRVLSVYMPAWVWLQWPSWTAAFLSTNPRVALRDSAFCRSVIESPWYQQTFEPDWQLADDQNAKSYYRNTKGGSRLAIGYNANIVGDRTDALIIDDPNDPEEAHSEVIRESVNTRWDDVLRNRVNDLRTSVRIVIQQRVHVDDLSGHILKNPEMPFEHLCLPMEKEDGPVCSCKTCKAEVTSIGFIDPRMPGELLFETRFPESVLKIFKKKSYTWTGQYQQKPLPAEGNLFNPKWWRFWRYRDEPEIETLAERTVVLERGVRWDRMAVSVDSTFKGESAGKKQKSEVDKVAVGTWAGIGPNKFLMPELAWDRMDIIKTMGAIRSAVKLYPGVTEVIVEDKANGPAVITLMQTEISGLVPVDPQGGKESRAAATSPQVEAGNVFLPLHAPWRTEYIMEHASFPKGTNDDAVDQQSQLLLRWGNSSHSYDDSHDYGRRRDLGARHEEEDDDD